jgi:hypothetical protein
MIYLSVIMFFLEALLYVALFFFIASTWYLIFLVKKNNYKLIKNSVSNPLFPNIDLSFFRKLQEEYRRQRSNPIPAIINRVSFYFLIYGFIVMILLVFSHEIVRYY